MLVHVEFEVGTVLGARASGMVSGRLADGTVFLRGSGIRVSSNAVLTSGALFPLGHRFTRLAVASSKDPNKFYPARLAELVALGDATSRMSGTLARLELVSPDDGTQPISAFGKSSSLQPGNLVVAIGAAFGVGDFAPALCCGCVATVPLPGSRLFLLDARAPPGFEGALVCSAASRAPLGMLLRSFGPSLPLSVAVALCANDVASTTAKTPAMCKALQGIVLLKCGNHWATGIVVNAAERMLLTCAHFIRNAEDAEAPIHCYIPTLQKDFIARVVCCAKKSIPWDVALLKVDKDTDDTTCWPSSLEADLSRDGVAGDVAFVVGFHVLGPADASHKDAGPVCLRGTLSKVVKVKDCDVPAMLLVSAPAFDGASGGAVVDGNGCTIGLCTGNLEGVGGVPAVCLAIPNAVLRGIIAARSVETFHTATFTTADVRNRIAAVWQLSFDFTAATPRLAKL